ncbi:sialidase family protein [Candidatus Zixiibacteriota bacterium]
MISCKRLFLLVLLGIALAYVAALAVPIPDNVPVTGSQPGLQNEEQVWICPKNTEIMITNHRDFRLGYRQIGLGYGIMGGMFWIDSLIHPDYQVFTHQSDPVMTVNSAGDIIISHLDYRGDLPYYDSSQIAFMVSPDCGATWDGPYTVTDTIGPWFEDKQFITSDRTGGTYDGNVYISWTRFDNPTRIMFARSTDGTQTFEDTIIVGPVIHECGLDIDAGQFSQPLVGKDGAVYVFWAGREIDPVECTSVTTITMNKSTDGGVTWQGERLLRPVYGNWWQIDGGVDVYNQPTTDADITDGPHAGNLYLQYHTVDINDYQSEIMFERSLDTGHTWSEPMRVNDDPLGFDVDQFHNWMVCNNDGYLVSIWYDQRMDPAHYEFDVFAAYSYDGGESWTSNHRVSSVSIDPDLLPSSMAKPRQESALVQDVTTMSPQMPMAGLIAEYIGVSCLRDTVVAVWTDTRFGDQDVWAAVWVLPLTEPRLIYPLAGEVVDETPGLLWATAYKETDDSYWVQIASDVGFTNIVDQDTVEVSEYDEVLPGLSDGLYYWRIKAYCPFYPDPWWWETETDWSAPGSFTLSGSVNDRPELTVPGPQSVQVGNHLSFTVSATDPDEDAIYISAEDVPDNATVDVDMEGTGYFDFDPDGTQVGDFNVRFIASDGELADTEYVEIIVTSDCYCGSKGDVDCNDNADPLDVSLMVNYVYLTRDARCYPGGWNCPYDLGDFDCNGGVDPIDIAYIVNLVYKGLDAICDGCNP